MAFIGKLALAASAILWISAAAAQDEERTTTVHHERSDPGAYIGVPGVAGVEVGGGHHGCTTRNKTVTDEETGETHSRTESNC